MSSLYFYPEKESVILAGADLGGAIMAKPPPPLFEK